MLLLLTFKKALSVLLIFSFMLMTMSKTPLILGMMVILQAMIMSFILILTLHFSWFTLLMFLIYIGGILMLFSYIISLCLFKSPMFKKTKAHVILALTMFFFWTSKETKMMNSKTILSETLMSMYSKSMTLSMFFMTMLLIIMTMIIFLSESSKGTMRSIN